MRHGIDIESLGPHGLSMTSAIDACVHCGFCLATCPTYVTLREEMDSPRGRIFLIKEVLEGSLELESALPFVDNCLGCQACETACPSGVDYGELITPFRAYAEERRRRPLAERARRRLLFATLPYPARLRKMARAGQLARRARRVLPRALTTMLDLLPAQIPPPMPLPAHYPAEGERRARVALLAGCAQQVLAPWINWATLRVLARNGIEVVVPKAQTCCGALLSHSGEAARARRFARANLRAFPGDVDAVITTAAGCGSGMQEYGLLFESEPERESAAAFASRVLDVTVFLADIGLREPPPPAMAPATVAYHDACHLAHAQGVRQPPRELLRAIDGLLLVDPIEWELCCGSAGIYNLEHPETAGELGARKATNLAATGATLVATGNVGCMTQLSSYLDPSLPVRHTMEVLDAAYSGRGLTSERLQSAPTGRSRR